MRMSFVHVMLATAALATGCGSPASPSAVPSASLSGVASQSEGGGPTTARQPDRSVPFTGTLNGTVMVTPLDPPLAEVLIDATGTATHLGFFHLEVPHRVSFATATGDGTYTFAAANGDLLIAHFTGVADTSTQIFTIVEHATITGGTGRFANATGSFTVHRSYDVAAGTTTGNIEGTIAF